MFTTMKQPIYPGIAPEDDPDIEVTYLEEPSASAGLWAEVKSITRDIIFAAVMAVLIVVFVVQPVKVEGTSMQPRLENDERIFVNKFEYTFSSIKRGDIIVFLVSGRSDQVIYQARNRIARRQHRYGRVGSPHDQRRAKR